MKTQSKGFSLIELLVVTAIIAILAAIGTTQYMKYIANSKYARIESFARQMILVAEDVYSEFQRYPSGTCSAISLTADLLCGVNASGTVVTGSANYNFKVPSRMLVSFIPKGASDIQILIESNLLTAWGGSGNAKIVFDSRTSSVNFSCWDNSIHKRNWPSGCP